MPQDWNFIKKETLAQVILRITWNFYEHLSHRTPLVAASGTTKTENKEDRVICLSRPKGNNWGIRKEIINKKGDNGSTVQLSRFAWNG